MPVGQPVLDTVTTQPNDATKLALKNQHRERSERAREERARERASERASERERERE